jgi:flagellar biogenesis protein FliO
MMKTIASENIVIGTLAGIGLMVLIVLFVYVVKRIMRDE